MPLYKKKPIIIEAFQWIPKYKNYPKWFRDALNKPWDEPGSARITSKVRIHTLEGAHYGSPYDFIIKGVKGELYPCKPDIFHATYEPVDDGQESEE